MHHIATMFLQLATIHRHELTSFMPDSDIVHMLQASNFIAKHVMEGATLHRVFTIKSLEELHSLNTFTSRWRLRVTCIHLMIDFKRGETLLDENGRSLLPLSLTRLSIGPVGLPCSRRRPGLEAPEYDIDLFEVNLGETADDNDWKPVDPISVIGESSVFEPLFQRSGVGYCEASYLRQGVCQSNPMHLPPLVPGILPEDIQYLHLNAYHEQDEYNYDLPPGTLPNSLRFLRLGLWHWPRTSIGRSLLPSGLTHLMLARAPVIEVGDLPDSLLELRIELGCNDIRPGSLPQSLRYLDVNCAINLTNGHLALPPSLVTCRLAQICFDSTNNLPSSLRHLDLQRCHPADVKVRIEELPEGLRFLSLPQRLHRRVHLHMLPSSLEYLEFSNWFNRPVVDRPLPSLPSLVGLALADTFVSALPDAGLPPSLRWLFIPEQYRNSLNVNDSCEVVFRKIR